MSDLKTKIIEAHGGTARWRQFKQLRAHLSQSGALWSLKGQGGVLDNTTVTVSLTDESASHEPFGMAGRYSRFTPGNVSIVSPDGIVEQDLSNPRASFAGHTLETPWNELQLAYFAGIAMWTYLNIPFILDHDGIETEDAGTWEENGETWHRLIVRFPLSIPTHSNVQTLYVGDDGLLRRHDYEVEIAGNTPGAHYISDYVDVEGIKIPTKRRIYPRQADNKPMAEPLVVGIDLDSIELI